MSKATKCGRGLGAHPWKGTPWASYFNRIGLLCLPFGFWVLAFIWPLSFVLRNDLFLFLFLSSPPLGLNQSLAHWTRIFTLPRCLDHISIKRPSFGKSFSIISEFREHLSGHLCVVFPIHLFPSKLRGHLVVYDRRENAHGQKNGLIHSDFSPPFRQDSGIGVDSDFD